MFSILKFELVKALHESQIGYKHNDNPYDLWENNVGECQASFYGVCSYRDFDALIPCFECIYYYGSKP